MLMESKEKKMDNKRQELEDIVNYILPQIQFKFVNILHEEDFGRTVGYRFSYIRSDGQHRYGGYRITEHLDIPEENIFDEELRGVLEIFKHIITDEYLHGDPKQRKKTLKTGFYKESIHFNKKDLNELAKINS